MARIAESLHHCRWFVIVAIVTALPAMTAAPVRAATDHVTNCDNSGTGSLPAVVTAATTGDTIVFDLNCPAAGPITLMAAISVSKNLVIDGTGHTIVISGGGTTEIFTITASGSLFLSDLTLRDGKAFQGGAIQTASTLTVTACTLVNNVATDAGATAGGAIDTSSGALLIVLNSTFTGNHIPTGSALGGAINVAAGVNATITDDTFTGNSAQDGGALFVSGTANVTNSTFTGNTATTGAGGLETGGNGATMTVRNSTIAGNTGGNFAAGGIFASVTGTTTLTNTIVAGNTATTNPDVRNHVTSGGHNLIGATDGSTGFTGTDLTGTAASPLDPKLGPLASNGGTTQTMALLFGSPAVSTGDPAVCTAAPVSGRDQRNTVRPAAFCAIGAFEPALAAVTNCNDTGAGSLRDRVSAAPANYTLFFDQDCTGGTPVLLTSEITIGKNVTVDGTGRAIVLSGGNSTRLFTVNSTFTLALTNLTLQNGNASSGDGGAILNSGTLNVTGCTFTGNVAGPGGAIATTGTATISGSTFASNHASGDSGALFISSGTATVANSTISHNSAGGDGGAIVVGLSATLTLKNDTIAGNSTAVSPSRGGGVQNLGTVNIANTIVAGNTGPATANGPDVFGTFASGGHNLIGKIDGSTGFTGPSDQIGSVSSPLDPRFSVAGLTNNGGPTQTIALQSGSSAIGTGDHTVCAQTGMGMVNGVDQRGSPRPAATCTIGAWEPPFITAISPNTGGTAGGNHVTITGGGIFPGASVIFSSGGCTNVTVISATTLTCVVPAGTGTVDVTMNSGGGFVGKVGAYTYGTVNPLPALGPTGGAPGGPNPLPNSRPSSGPSGSPNPLPQPRFG